MLNEFDVLACELQLEITSLEQIEELLQVQQSTITTWTNGNNNFVLIWHFKLNIGR